MYYYRCYGLEIASEIEMLALLSSKETKADVCVCLKERIHFEKEGAKYINGFWVNAQGEVFFEVDFGAMLVSGGSCIAFDLAGNGSIEEAVQHVLGSGIAAILMQQKKLVLHASAVMKKGKAILFVGHSGVGKSSTAWTCIKNGYKAISDDLAVIDFEDGVPYVHHGFPRSKVSEDVILETEHKIDESETPFNEDRLKYYRYPEQFVQSKVPISNIFLLSQKEVGAPKLTQNVDSILIFQVMYRNSFRFSLIEPLGFTKLHLKLCTDLFKKVEVKSIQIPNDKLALNSTFELIDKQLK